MFCVLRNAYGTKDTPTIQGHGMSDKPIQSFLDAEISSNINFGRHLQTGERLGSMQLDADNGWKPMAQVRRPKIVSP